MANAPLIQNEDSPDLQTIQGKFSAGLSELIAYALDGGMTTHEIVDLLLGAEIPKLRQPYQNAEDNAASLAAG